jgi:hypothetical protein
MSKKGGGSFVTGYKYYRGEHHVLGHGPADELLEIKIGDRVAWSGSNTGGEIAVNKPNLFGGQEREGGIVGKFLVLMGHADQEPPAPLLDLYPIVPAFRGLFSILFPRLYYGANNPYPKKIEYMWRRRHVLCTDEPQWYDAKVEVGEDMNPAHMFRECLTDSSWGGQHPVIDIDDANFRAAADTFHAEGLGLSFYWANPSDFDKFIGNLEAHCACHLRINPESNKYELKLIRDDYNVEDLPVYDESNIIKVLDYQGNQWDGTVNEVILIYYDIVKDQMVPVVMQDLGNQRIQGRKVSKQIRMEGICDPDLAVRICDRERRVLTTPLASVQFSCNRSAWGLNKGDPFVFSFAVYKVASVVFRVTSVDWGTLEDGEVTITAIQDVFGLPSASYALPPSSLWVAESRMPLAPIAQRAVEATYWDVVTNISKADIDYLDPDYGFVSTMAVRANGLQLSYQLWTRVGAADYAKTGSGAFCPSCLIAAAIAQEVASVWTYSSDVDIDEVIVGRYGYINDEIVEITAIDTDLGAVSVNRGALDTVPTAHAGGSRLYFTEGWQVFDFTERMALESVDAKLLPVAPEGIYDIASATELTVNLDNRPQRPYPPGNVKLNGDRYPASTVGDIVITWSHRDRTQQTAYIVDQTETDIGPEASTTYTIRIYNTVGNVLEHTESALAGKTWTYTQAARLADFGGAGPHSIRFEIESERSGLESYQHHAITISATDS